MSNEKIKSAIFASGPSALDFKRAFKDRLSEILAEKLESGEVFDLLEEESHVGSGPFPEIDNSAELDAVAFIRSAVKMMGASDDDTEYNQGVFFTILSSKQAAMDLMAWLDACDVVDDYEVEITNDNPVTGYADGGEYDIDDIQNDSNFHFEFTIYLDPDIVTYDPEEEEVDEIPESIDNGYITEVRRRIKVDFRGKRRIKMQCRPGFKWDVQRRACVKIAGAELAQQRRRLRRATLTKKSKGAGFKARVLRKMRRAKRFRKSMGLNP